MRRNSLSEAQTRLQLIDTQLAQAGWNRQRRGLISEYLITAEDTKGPGHGNQYADYVLLGSDGIPLALVEAKKTSRDELAGKRQSADYADALREKFRSEPFIFLTNGRELQFWDRERYPPRKISGFYTRDDLERLLHQRKYAQPLSAIALNSAIAGRIYQNEAVRRITESVDIGKRKFLLVMATGTGKTRTTIALIDALLRARRVQRVLFLADRRELVKQAMGEFKTHLPNESLARIEFGETSGARIQFATYPSMFRVYERLSAGYYDVIIADESHRSIYRSYSPIFRHFDAIQIGLTATPTEYIDHNTFDIFECSEGIPSYYYSYEQAIADKNLVSYRVLDARTNFQISGIHGPDLPIALQNMARDQGVDVEELKFEGTAIENGVINQGTNDAIVREFMDKCRKDSRGLPHKTIIFAVSHAHAKRLYESFNRLFPEHQRHGLAEIIDSHMERASLTLDDFKFKSMPRVAITVDMLDTGVDVPAVKNLVFARPVFSKMKFWQMIGRGTRLYSDPDSGEEKKDFLIIDHWKNFAYFKLNPDGEVGHVSEPLPVRLFRVRLERWQVLRSTEQPTAGVVDKLREMVRALPRQTLDVRAHIDEIDSLLAQWPEPSSAVLERLRHTIAPLMRLTFHGSLDQLQFEIWCESLSTALQKGDLREQLKVRERVRDAIASLADNIPDVQRVAEERAWVLSQGFWDHLDERRIELIQGVFSPVMRFRVRNPSRTVEIDLPDSITQRSWIIYGPTGEGAFAETYRDQVEVLIRRLSDQLPELAKLRRGGNLTSAELDHVSAALNQADLFVTEDTLRKAFDAPAASLADFLRHTLCDGVSLPNREAQVNAAFDAFVAKQGNLRANQLNFLRALKAAIISHGRITRSSLEKPPFSRVGRVDALFRPHEIEELMSLADKLAAQAA